ncbi:MAG: ComF family protein [Clostridia bacterium]|nr:ComF family protein [Clostridia bacterium]
MTFAAVVDTLQDVVFGRDSRCVICGRRSPRGGMCGECIGRIPLVLPPVCQLCGTPLRLAQPASGPLLCSGCHGANHYFERARAAAVYDGAAREHVQDLKYRGRVEIAPVLARMMARAAVADGMVRSIDVIVPVPLHPDRAIRRGYNQAELLAHGVGACLGVRVAPAALERHASTGTQTHLHRRDRRSNVIHAFTCAKPSHISGRAVLLIDDVFTSGATADGCCRSLLRAGAASVRVLAFAVSVADERDWFTSVAPC